MKRNLFILSLPILCILVLAACGSKNHGKTDLSSSHTTLSPEAMSSEPQSTEPVKIQDTAAPSSSSPAEKGTGSKVAAAIQTYKDGSVSIQYPLISGLEDSSKEEAVNALFKSNALEILKAYSIKPDKDTLSVTCKVISADRKRASAVYTGSYTGDQAAHPVQIFFTDTVDLTQAKNISLKDYADPYTIAGYILSADCSFYKASPELTKALMEQRTDTSLKDYTKLLNQADFPVKGTASDGTSGFPQSFSYEDQGTIIVSIPVPHALGDFALIEYTPETK